MVVGAQWGRAEHYCEHGTAMVARHLLLLNISPSAYFRVTNWEGAWAETLEDLRGKQVVYWRELTSLSEAVAPNTSKNPLPQTYLICSKQDGPLGGVQTLEPNSGSIRALPLMS